MAKFLQHGAGAVLALLSVWLGLAALVMSLAAVVYRPLLTDTLLTIDLYTCVLTLTFSGLVLWASRHEPDETRAARLQAKVGAVLAAAGAAIMYALVAFAEAIPVA